MDFSKICDSQLNHRNHSIVSQLLEARQSQSRKDSISSVETQIVETKKTTTLPCFSFCIIGYSIGQHVEYSIELLEEYTVLGRKRVNKYRFKTRYSLLEVLDSKLGGRGLPGKRLFGNKDPKFLEKRKNQLQEYLNQLARKKQFQFLKFIKQIKDIDFNRSMKEKFVLQ